MEDGEEIKYLGCSDEAPNAETGNLIIVFNLKKNDHFNDNSSFINRQIKAVLLVYGTQNWSVYKLNRENMRSIWSTDKCIHNIIIPNENPAYVSSIEESFFSYLYLK